LTVSPELKLMGEFAVGMSQLDDSAKKIVLNWIRSTYMKRRSKPKENPMGGKQTKVKKGG